MVQIVREQIVTWPVDGPCEMVAPALSVTVQVSPTVARRRATHIWATWWPCPCLLTIHG